LDHTLPTDKSYVIPTTREFAEERDKAIIIIKKFIYAGLDYCTRHPHYFFGKLTPEEWAIRQWKHIDHHLRQFAA
jgi:transposase InsO family protein